MRGHQLVVHMPGGGGEIAAARRGGARFSPDGERGLGPGRAGRAGVLGACAGVRARVRRGGGQAPPRGGRGPWD